MTLPVRFLFILLHSFNVLAGPQTKHLLPYPERLRRCWHLEPGPDGAQREIQDGFTGRDEVRPCEPIVREETFGPVLVVQSASDFEEAVELANGVSQGLVASVFSKHQAERFVERLDAGVIKINQTTAGVVADAPFGGAKSSAIGPAEHGPSDRCFYTRAVTVYPDEA